MKSHNIIKQSCIFISIVLTFSIWENHLANVQYDSCVNDSYNNEVNCSFGQSKYGGLQDTPVRGRRLLVDGMVELAADALFVSFRNVLSYTMRKIYGEAVPATIDNVQDGISFSYNYFLKKFTAKRKALLLLGDAWYDKLMQTVISGKLREINPHALKSFKKIWNEELIKSGEDKTGNNVFEVLVVTVNRFQARLTKARVEEVLTDAIGEIVKKKSYGEWVDPDILKAYNKTHESTLEEKLEGQFIELSIKTWPYILVLITPHNEVLESTVRQKYFNLWLFILNESESIIFEEIFRLDGCLLAYQGIVKVMKPKEKIGPSQPAFDSLLRQESWNDLTVNSTAALKRLIDERKIREELNPIEPLDDIDNDEHDNDEQDNDEQDNDENHD